MKLGAENRKMVIGAIIAAVAALVFVARMVMVLNEAPPAQAAAQPAGPGQQLRRDGQARPPAVASLDPALRLDVLRATEEAEYKGSGRNIFDYKQRPIEQPVVNVDKGPKVLPPQCPGDPRCPPPPIPLKFYGVAVKPGEPKRALLSSTTSDDLFIAAEGEIVNRRYRVLRIGVNSVEIEDVLSNNRQTIPLTQG